MFRSLGRFWTRNRLHFSFAYLLSRPFSLLLICLVGVLVLYQFWNLITSTVPFGIRFFFDEVDVSIYFKSSRWAAGQGILYKDVFSEYPFFANLIFGFFRVLAEFFQLFSSSLQNFWFFWISGAWFIYVWILYQVATKISKQALWVWLAPAPLYFSLLRFDIYPAVMTLLALFAIRKEKYFQGAFWLGFAIALKGYVLFLLPSYFVFLCYRKGFLTSLKITAFCLVPFLFSNLAVFAYSGLEGLTKPYSFHITRDLNRESSYDAIIYIFHLQFLRNILDFPKIARFLQIGISLFAAWLQPKRFKDLVDSFLLAIVGFMSFSTFYSPQFVLWSAPIACFSRSRWINFFAIAFSWMTYLYFPVVYDINRIHGGLWKVFFCIVIVLVTAIRFTMIYGSFRRLLHQRFKGREALQNTP